MVFEFMPCKFLDEVEPTSLVSEKNGPLAEMEQRLAFAISLAGREILVFHALRCSGASAIIPDGQVSRLLAVWWTIRIWPASRSAKVWTFDRTGDRRFRKIVRT
jgi:hypothetical protein